ncbi:hypothetical protein FPSE_03327 [Fusarium pseudograminearum CS3096]|uniref:Bacteriophage T5 Orf172 DNA-binding domain-containing protein n=1 Tax=Fusarium pseudograminearum (strain CS3096) TaxID=1028729 RepID=K3W1U0_FUSPC|nr:hypothetical protein FPSE_03327 [Fusarium pseudograminearum CS3096]EKJ76485.1 hypothetical protein FPSE_03327 [Fusarium pseudograminearum CS3096]KAF0640625.1 hypothetical protein FPSE5266_03327 [Fusarium pseudograminearum]
MKPNDSSSNALSSLYEAIGLSEGDTTMRCFGQAQGDIYCVTPLPNTRKPKIKRLLQNLARHELGSECPDAARTVEMTLAELTKNLICLRPIKPHAVKFEIHRKSYKNNMEYVYFLLTSKFESWQLERKAEEQRNNRQHTPTRTLQKSLAKLNGHESNSKNVGYSGEDAYDSSYGDGDERDDEISEEDDGCSEETKDEDVFDTRIREKLQRPKLVRESPQGERDILVTPVRCRRERNQRMVHSGTKAAKDSYDSPSSLSPSDDEFIVSPESVTSPDPSELFTPFSTVSTPGSLASTVEFESRRSSSRISHRKRQDASPTRGAESTDLDILSKDMRRKLNLSGSLSGTEEDFGDEGSSDTQSQNCESDKEAATRPKFRQPIIFFPKNQPVHEILKYMRKSPGKKGFGPGCIYGFTDPTIRGRHIKIGYTDGSVEKRMKEWETCGYKPILKFEVPMPCAVKKMEGLIHSTLHIEAEYASCPAESCKKKHREWFNISKREAKGVVEMWKRFSELMPYTETRQLNDIWQGIATAQLAKPWSPDAKVWLKEELLAIVSKEEKLAKLQDSLDKKKQEREGIKQQLLQAEEDEERLRKQLEGLAIGNR